MNQRINGNGHYDGLRPGTEATPEPLWTALRYVLDELNADEVAIFEARLPDDEAAQSAVAQAVELLAAYRLAEAEIELETVSAHEFAAVQPTHSDSGLAELVPAADSNPWSAVGWLSLGVAACLAMLISYQTWSPALAPSAGRQLADAGSSKSRTTPEMAIAWAQLSADNVLGDNVLVDDLDLGSLVAANLDGENGEFTPEGSTTLAEDDSLASHPLDDATVPSWLLMAIEIPKPVKN